MKTIIEVNKGQILDEDLIKTDNGWVKAKELKVGNHIFEVSGKVIKIEKLHTCGKRKSE